MIVREVRGKMIFSLKPIFKKKICEEDCRTTLSCLLLKNVEIPSKIIPEIPLDLSF